MKKAGIRIRDLILVVGVVVALCAGIFSTYLYYESDPVTQPPPQETKMENEPKGSVLTGALSLVFKNGLELVRVVRNSN